MLVAALVVVLTVRPTAVFAAGPNAGHPTTAVQPDEQTSDNAPSAADPRTTAATASASCVRPPGRDAGGNVASYDPGFAIDGKPDTAWRCNGEGIGNRLTISFAAPVALRAIVIVPGFAKTDAYDGTDRYTQNDRISAATLTFDSGSTVHLQLDPSPANRQPQVFRFTPCVSQQVAITIDESAPGQAVNGQPPIDAVAISEVAFG
jgi:hypothetical protein